MFEEDEEIPDWEIQDEEVPEKLQQKWDREEIKEAGTVVCQSCGKRVNEDALLCLYCGESTGVKAGLFSWLRYYLLKYLWGIPALLIIMIIVLMLLLY